MPELDFGGLRTVAEDAVRQPEFATVERRSARLRRRRHGAAAAILAVVLAGTTVAAARLDRPQSTTPVLAASPTHLNQVLYLEAVDTTHLYAVGFPCAACPFAMNASDDGGRTWEGRTLPNPRSGVIVLGPRLLISGASVSVDGGLSWRAAARTDTPVEAVAPGHQAWCVREATGCRQVLAVDPTTGQIAPLANQPPIDTLYVVATPTAAGLWVGGFDRATDRPALSWSRDGGRTWAVHVFLEAPAVPSHSPLGFAPQPATADGQTVYAMIGNDTDTGFVYRTTDGGATWSIVRQGEHIESYLGYVTADGAHVLQYGVTPMRYVASRDGGPYLPVELSGDSDQMAVPRAVDDGYVARDGGYLYLSDDGWTWRREPLP